MKICVFVEISMNFLDFSDFLKISTRIVIFLENGGSQGSNGGSNGG